jgi:hypothetical protein
VYVIYNVLHKGIYVLRKYMQNFNFLE